MEAKLKVSQVIEAMEKNGFPFTTGTVYEPRTGASCIFGQAARNLFPEMTGYDDILEIGWGLISVFSAEFDGAGNDIWHFNDSRKGIFYQEKLDYEEVLAYARKRMAGKEDQEFILNIDLRGEVV